LPTKMIFFWYLFFLSKPNYFCRYSALVIIGTNKEHSNLRPPKIYLVPPQKKIRADAGTCP
jgi:hypothetical protein